MIRILWVNQGGISSYGISLLLIAFFQEMELIGKIQNFSISETGLLFKLFFEFYTVHKIQQFQIVPYLPGYSIIYSPLSRKQEIISGMVVIDPLNNSNNVTKSAFNSDKIDALIEFIYFSLHQNFQGSVLNHVFEIPKILLFLNHNWFFMECRLFQN